METKFSKSWKEFKESEDGQSALNLETLKNLTDPKYLENRLHTAFSAGYNANIPLDGLVMPLADLEKLRLEFEKKFTYGGITGIAAFQNANPVEVWEFFITRLPKIIKSA